MYLLLILFQKNSWDKIAANIALKDGEYPGEKDVTKMR